MYHACSICFLKLRQIFNELCEWRGSGISIPWIHKYTLIFRRSKPFTDDPELFLQKGIDLFYIYLTLFFTNKLRPSKFLLANWRNVVRQSNWNSQSVDQFYTSFKQSQGSRRVENQSCDFIGWKSVEGHNYNRTNLRPCAGKPKET